MTEDLSLAIYSLDAIKRAAYRFVGEVSIRLESIDRETVRVHFGVSSDADPAGMLERFYNELLDQDLRERLQQETLPFQNLIMAHAFSGLTTMPVDAPGNSDPDESGPAFGEKPAKSTGNAQRD